MSIISKPIIDEAYIKFINQHGFIKCPMFDNVELNMNGNVKVDGKLRKYNSKKPKLYYRVKINGQRYSLNRLMAVTWLDIKYDDDCIVDHFDHNRHNNDIDNLRVSNKSINASNIEKAKLTNPNPANLISLNQFNSRLYYDKSTKQFLLKLYDDLYKTINIITKTNQKTKTEYKSIKFSQNNIQHCYSCKKLMKYINDIMNPKPKTKNTIRRYNHL